MKKKLKKIKSNEVLLKNEEVSQIRGSTKSDRETYKNKYGCT
jgi:hypothetical protein